MLPRNKDEDRQFMVELRNTLLLALILAGAFAFVLWIVS